MAAGGASSAPHAPSIDTRTMFLLLHSVTEDNARYFGQQRSEASRRFVAAFGRLQEDGRGLQPLLAALAAHAAAHDLDPATPANGYRSLGKVVRRCVMHAVHKSRYVAASRRSVFFRAGHNLMEVEAYSSALRQLRALLYFATSLLAANRHGDLFFSDHERGLSDEFLRESNTMHKGCFYGRCLGFQFSPSIRPFLQTISIGLVSFGENYRKHETKLGTAATSIFTSGKYAIDPELRGAEFERLTQNLDIHFWKAFWNITETEIMASLVTLTSTTVRVNRVLSVPPHIIAMPLAIDPTLTVAITPPVAHFGPGPVQMRLISYELREGQDSEELSGLCGVEPALGADGRPRGKRAPPSPSLIVHFHGGGFVAQTSKSHEPYLRSWAQELDSPILSVDYSLAPEAPFPRALEECFFAYCWALKNCRLLGSTCERVCVAGDSAGGNLCLAVCMQASAYGVRMPDGVMAAYPATLLQATASPSRLLTFIDPLLPISVLSKCLSAYAGLEPAASAVEKVDPLSVVRNDTAVLLRGIRMGASAWLSSLLDSGRNSTSHDMMRKSCSETALSTAHSSSSSLDSDADFVLCPTCPLPAGPPAGAGTEEREREREGQPPPSSRFPRGFQPLRSGAGNIRLQSSDTVRNPLMSPLLAPEHTLRKMPPVHLVACALDPMLDDSVMYARRLRSVSRPVTLSVVDDLPHGFLSLSPLSRETRRASALCASKIREVLAGRVPPILPPYTPPPPGPEMPTSSSPPRSPTTPPSSSSSTPTPPRGSPPRSYSSRLSPETARRPSPVHSRSPSPKQPAAPLGPTDASPLPPTTTAPPPNTATIASAPTMTALPTNTTTPPSAPTMTATNKATPGSAPTMTATNTATPASAPTMTATNTATPASAPTMTATPLPPPPSPPAPEAPPAPRGHRKLERLVPKNPASPPPH